MFFTLEAPDFLWHHSPSKGFAMVRSGKEHAALSLAPAAIADDATTQDTRWLNGVNRQLRPDAASQRQAASAAAAAKRKAMTGEEKAAAERRRSDRRNEGKGARRAEANEGGNRRRSCSSGRGRERQ